MLNLIPHHRFHVPNGLAMLAAVLLLVSSVAGFNSDPELNPAAENVTPSVKVENSDNNEMNAAAENKRRGLNLGFLLFRRG